MGKGQLQNKGSSATFSCLIAFHLHGITPFLNV